MRPRCAAVVGEKRRYQIEWAQRCQQSAIHVVRGVGLCGTHVNAIHEAPIPVISELRAEE